MKLRVMLRFEMGCHWSCTKVHSHRRPISNTRLTRNLMSPWGSVHMLCMCCKNKMGFGLCVKKQSTFVKYFVRHCWASCLKALFIFFWPPLSKISGGGFRLSFRECFPAPREWGRARRFSLFQTRSQTGFTDMSRASCVLFDNVFAEKFGASRGLRQSTCQQASAASFHFRSAVFAVRMR